MQLVAALRDHPKLSVAAIFRPYRSLAPYIQFVGRILRVIVQGKPGHPDNLGHIVTHAGMNLDKCLEDFKMFEKDDQSFWEGVIGGEDPELPPEVKEGNTRLRFAEPGVVNHEIVDSLFEEDFTSADDEHLIEELEERLALYGLDPEVAEEIVKNHRQQGMKKSEATAPLPVQPQRQWQQYKLRLADDVKHHAKVVLNNVDLNIGGSEIPWVYRSLGIIAANNMVAVMMMLNKRIATGINDAPRSQWSSEEFKNVIDALPKMAEQIVRQIKKVQSEYEQDKRKG